MADGVGRVTAIATLLGASVSADATAPGRNGRIVSVHLQSLYTSEPDGTGSRRVFGPGAFEPAWSADGRRIAFTSTRDGDAEPYVVDADGGHLRQLTRNRVRDASPTWSPDGTESATSPRPSTGSRCAR